MRVLKILIQLPITRAFARSCAAWWSMADAKNCATGKDVYGGAGSAPMGVRE